jgi:hypothetical protein
MKNKLFLAGVLGFALVLGLVLSGCDNGNGNGGSNATKFEGVWRNPNGSHQTYTFTENTVTRTADDDITWSATFDFTDTAITFTPASGNSWTQNYILSGSVLSLDVDENHPYGPFLFQKTGATKFEGTWKNSGGEQPTYAFTDNRVVLSNNTGGTWEGIFAFTDDSITFTSSLSVFWTQDYTFSGNTLTLSSDGQHSFGNFQKQ